jgi:hypothetical protein
MSGESLERLMEVILQMRINLAHITETLHQQTYEMREQLGVVFEEEKHALEGCLDGIDEKLKECSACVAEYQRLYASLSNMRQRLVQLGAEPSTLPPPIPTNNVEDVIAWRVRELKEQGKF